MKTLYNYKIVLCLLLTSLFTTRAFSQAGTRILGMDALTSGRAGTVTGTFDNPSLIMNNPAGLSFLDKAQLDISFDPLITSTHFKNNINDKKGEHNVYPLFSVGYAAKPGKKWTYGFGIYTHGGMGTNYKLNHALYTDESGNYIPQDVYNSLLLVAQGGGSVAYKISDKFSVGASTMLVYSRFEFGEPFSIPPALMQGVIDPNTGTTFGNFFSTAPPDGLGYSEVVANTKIKGLESFGFSGKIGFAYKPNDRVSIGLTYISPTKLNLKNGNASLDLSQQFRDAFGRVVIGIMQQSPDLTQVQAQEIATQQFTQLGIDLSAGATDHYDTKAKLKLPQSISIGASVKATDKWTVSADVEWINWKNAFKTLDFSLTGGSNPNANRLLGTNGTINAPFPLNWKDVFAIRAGAEYDISKIITARAGYSYNNNPIPSSTIFPLLPAVLEHHATVGASVKLSDKIRLNGAYEHGFKNKVGSSATSLVG